MTGVQTCALPIWFDFQPEFKLILATNHKPDIRGTDHAIWRRVRLVPFNVVIPDAKQDAMLATKLAKELPGILAWMVQGCLAWQRDGLGTPNTIKKATAAYRNEQDILSGFFEECCLFGENYAADSETFYRVYVAWCERTGEKPLRMKELAPRLEERGLRPGRVQVGDKGARKQKRGWIGVGFQKT